MAKILTNDNIATPQAGGSVCAVKTIKLTLKAEELVVDATFNLGKAPKGWTYKEVMMSADNVGELDTGVGLRLHIGTNADESYYYYNYFPTSATAPAAGGNGSLYEFPDEDIILKVLAPPTTATDGTLTVVLFGYA